MKFSKTEIAGVFIVDIEPINDHRGFFARSWCPDEFKSNGLDPNLNQCNISFNIKKGTLRGLHFQTAPHSEAKLVRCTQGSIFDVAVDLRPDSPTFKKWVSAELSADNHRALFIPKGLAHGFQSLTDTSEVLYHMSDPYVPESAQGLRWNDPAFNITWPLPNPILSDKDRAYPDFKA